MSSSWKGLDERHTVVDVSFFFSSFHDFLNDSRFFYFFLSKRYLNNLATSGEKVTVEMFSLFDEHVGAPVWSCEVVDVHHLISTHQVQPLSAQP